MENSENKEKHEHQDHDKKEHKSEHHKHDKKEHKTVHHKHHEHDKEHKTQHHKKADVKTRIKKRILKAKRDRNIFIGTTILFLVLFLVTILTQPKTTGIDENIDNLNLILANLESEDAKSAVTNAITNLEAAKKTLNPDYEELNNSEEPTENKPIDVNKGDLVMTILNDERCVKCDVTALKQSLQQVFPEIKFKEIDYMTEEGKQLYNELNLQVLPALLFNEQVIAQDNYEQVKNYLTQKGEYYDLNVGSSFDPTSEICDNEKDDTGNGLVDCNDPECENSLACRPLKENHVSVFIMSDCPYGKEAVKALAPVIEQMPDLEYEINYIVTDMGDGNFRSLHGDYEVEENIRQLCAKDISEENYFDYVLCRIENGVNGVDWKNCAEETGYDTEELEACTTGERGTELLSENAKIAAELGIGASPTWLANNRYKFSGISSDVVQANVCAANPDLTGCDEQLTNEATVPAGQC